jgi:hypothetical protein
MDVKATRVCSGGLGDARAGLFSFLFPERGAGLLFTARSMTMMSPCEFNKIVSLATVALRVACHFCSSDALGPPLCRARAHSSASEARADSWTQIGALRCCHCNDAEFRLELCLA